MQVEVVATPAVQMRAKGEMAHGVATSAVIAQSPSSAISWPLVCETCCMLLVSVGTCMPCAYSACQVRNVSDEDEMGEIIRFLPEQGLDDSTKEYFIKAVEVAARGGMGVSQGDAKIRLLCNVVCLSLSLLVGASCRVAGASRRYVAGAFALAGLSWHISLACLPLCLSLSLPLFLPRCRLCGHANSAHVVFALLGPMGWRMFASNEWGRRTPPVSTGRNSTRAIKKRAPSLSLLLRSSPPVGADRWAHRRFGDALCSGKPVTALEPGLAHPGSMILSSRGSRLVLLSPMRTARPQNLPAEHLGARPRRNLDESKQMRRENPDK